MNPFNYEVGGFYVSDDDTGFVYQYFTRLVDDDANDDNGTISIHQHHPTLKTDSTTEIDSDGNAFFAKGTEFEITDSFAKLRHLDLVDSKTKDYLETDIFIRSLSMKVVEAPTKEGATFTEKVRKLQVGVVDGAGNRVNSEHAWKLYTPTSLLPSTGCSDDCPSISSEMKKPDYSIQNSVYGLKPGASEPRIRIYLWDTVSGYTYVTHITDLEVIQDGTRTE